MFTGRGWSEGSDPECGIKHRHFLEVSSIVAKSKSEVKLQSLQRIFLLYSLIEYCLEFLYSQHWVLSTSLHDSYSGIILYLILADAPDSVRLQSEVTKTQILPYTARECPCEISWSRRSSGASHSDHRLCQAEARFCSQSLPRSELSPARCPPFLPLPFTTCQICLLSQLPAEGPKKWLQPRQKVSWKGWKSKGFWLKKQQLNLRFSPLGWLSCS